MEIFLILFLIFLNGVFSMAEMALINSKKFKLESEKKKGRNGANIALALADDPTRFLSTVQIGMTLIGILLGVFSSDNLTADLEKILLTFNIEPNLSHSISVTLIVMVVTFLSIVFGELLPKRLGLAFSEPIAIVFARPMMLLSHLTAPFVWLLSITNDSMLKLLGIKAITDSKVSEQEIKNIIKESVEGGEIQEIEHNIVERVFELGDRKVNTLFTHRNDIVFFNETDSWDIVRNKVNEEKHSAYPVTKNNNIDEIIGIVMLKDLFIPNDYSGFNLLDFLKKPLFLNENAYAYNVLELFKTHKSHHGIVIDEFGSTEGIVSMDDVLDALIGDLSEDHHDEYQIVQRDVSSWLVDGQYSIVEFFRYFNIEWEEEYDHKFTTVAGLLLENFSILPNVGEKIKIDNLELEIVDKDGQRIDKILVTKLSESSDNGEEAKAKK